MKFKIEHVFHGISLENYEQLYFDETFNIALCEAVGLGRELLKLERQESILKREVRVQPNRDLPAVVTKLFGDAKIQYVEYLTYDFNKRQGEFETVPAMLKDKLESSGTFTFKAQPDGVLRVIEGKMDVKIFGIGSMIERLIVADIEKSYQQAADFTQSWLKRYVTKSA